MNEKETTPSPAPDDTTPAAQDDQPTRALEAPEPSPGADSAGHPTEVLGQPTPPSPPDAPSSPSTPPAGYSPAAGPPPWGQGPASAPPSGGYPPPAAATAPSGGYPPTGTYPPPPGPYPPPGVGYAAGGFQGPPSSPPPGGYPPPDSYPPPGGFPPAPARGQKPRLTRSRSDRAIGGVCGGLARYWNTDPTLLRILTVVLTLATGGAFLIGYLIAWLAIPDEPLGPTSPFGQPADQVGYASGGNPAYADYPAEYIPPAPRERSYLGWLILSAAVLAAGVLGLLGFLVPASVGIWGVILAVALTILGIGLLIGSRYGRARWLLWLAIPLAFITFGTVQASNFVRDNPDWQRWTATTEAEGWGGLTIGERTWAVGPDDTADSPLEFQLSAGSAVLDLTQLSDLGTEEADEPTATARQVRIDAGVGVGELLVLVPVDMKVDLTASVSLGEIRVPGSSLNDGTDLDVQTTIDPLAGTDPAYTVTLDAAIGAGSLEVRREEA